MLLTNLKKEMSINIIVHTTNLIVFRFASSLLFKFHYHYYLSGICIIIFLNGANLYYFHMTCLNISKIM